MIDITKLEKSEEPINVIPSDNLFKELGKNTYTYRDKISELIDNSIAARFSDKILKIKILVYYKMTEAGRKAVRFIIKDNARGIKQEIFGEAISPAAKQTKNSLNEHGMGMKQAISGLGKLKYLVTKIREEAKARAVLEFKFGNIDYYYTDEFKQEHGTEICIEDLEVDVTVNASTITQVIEPYLGARYRKYLKPDNKKLELKILLINADTNEITNEWDVTERKPVYFHPSTRTNKPVIDQYVVEGDKWKAELTFGYAPTSEEYKELGIPKPLQYEPYYVSQKKQGIDIILHDRIILFHQLYQVGITNTMHPNYNNIRGELVLKDGFTTAITKNSIVEDEHYLECLKKVSNILNGIEAGPTNEKRDYLKTKQYPDKLPHNLLRDRLAKWLRENTLASRKEVICEYTIGGIDGQIDILADGEVWEIKPDQASAKDVYQVFMYMDVGGKEKGYLVAKEFTTGAKCAVEHIANKHKKQIRLGKLNEFPINHSPTVIEREKYYK